MSQSGPSRFRSNGIRIPLPVAVSVTSWVMTIGFLLSILSAVLFNFRRATDTHCGVPNYLPSVSASIAVPPASYIWRLTVTLCSSQRVTAVFGHFSIYSSLALDQVSYRLLCWICAVLEMTENVSLIGLTCISSTEFYKAHELFFIAFQASSMFYMLSVSFLYKQAINHGVGPTREESQILKKKFALLLTNVVAFLTAIYLFFRHNWFCEPGVYSLFALCEYVVVTTNINFHYTVSRYFSDRELRLGCRVNSKK